MKLNFTGKRSRIIGNKSKGYDVTHASARTIIQLHDSSFTEEKYKEIFSKWIKENYGIKDEKQVNNYVLEPLGHFVTTDILEINDSKMINILDIKMLEFISESYENSIIFLYQRTVAILEMFGLLDKVRSITLESSQSEIIAIYDDFLYKHNEKVKNDPTFKIKKINEESTIDPHQRFALLIDYITVLEKGIHITRGLKPEETSNPAKTLAINTQGTRNNVLNKKNEYINNLNIEYILNNLNVEIYSLIQMNINQPKLSELEEKLDNSTISIQLGKRKEKYNLNGLTDSSQEPWALYIKGYFNNKCFVCGVTTNSKRYIQGSHILDKSYSDDYKIKYNKNNGIALCSNHHILFDNGDIWIEDNKFYVSKEIAVKEDRIIKMFGIPVSDGEIYLSGYDKLEQESFEFFKEKNSINRVFEKQYSEYKIKKKTI